MSFKLKSGNKTSFKQRGATEAIKQVDTSSTGYPSQDKSKMRIEKEIYKAKLRGDYQDLTGDKLKKASYDDPTGQVMSRDPHYLDSPVKDYKKGYYGEGKSSPAKGKKPDPWIKSSSDLFKTNVGGVRGSAIGGGPGEAVEHWQKYKAAKAQAPAVDKLATNKNISKKAFDSKLAKITKRPPKDAIIKKGVKKVASKSIANVASKVLGGVGVAATLYDFYKSGQKHSGGKIKKDQKSIWDNKKSIFKK